MTFDTWWRDEGRFIDPDTSDVPWFDKREELAHCAFDAAASGLEAAEAIVDALPKCWRLVDGELVQDCPVVPGMRVWRIKWPTALGHVVVGVRRTQVRLNGMGDLCRSDELADTREAAEALAKRRDGG